MNTLLTVNARHKLTQKVQFCAPNRGAIILDLAPAAVTAKNRWKEFNLLSHQLHHGIERPEFTDKRIGLTSSF